MIEDFKEVDQEMDSIIEKFPSTIESSPIGHEIEVMKEDTSPPIPLVSNKEESELEGSYQEEEVGQEASYIIEDNSTPNDIGDLVEDSSNGCEVDVEVDFTQPQKFDLIDDEEELEEVDKQGEVGRSCQEVELIKKEHKGMTLAKPLEISLPKSPSSNTTFKWVKFISLSFTSLQEKYPFKYTWKV